ncbi:MAG: adenylate/guanylate cyclase domain-containing protein [Actinobacteria bacterium]|nr:adenylate/guanylate cyclase domain-containing protein [Actinomycetota bacterium]
MRKRRRIRMYLLLGVAAATLALGLVAYASEWFERAELDTVDLRFAIRGDQPPPNRVVVVGVDDKTFDDLDVQWPFKRGLHARVMDRLARDGAKVIAYDVQFTEPSPFPREDERLLDAAERHAERLVLATAESDGGRTKVLGDGEAFEAIGGRVGNAVLPADPNAVRRRVPHSIQGVASFAVATVEQGTGRRVEREPFGDRGAWIDFHGPGGTLPFVSFSDVLRGEFAPGTFRGAYVVVGAANNTLHDEAPTSTSGSELMWGPEIQAEAVETILSDFPLRDSPGWVGIAALLVLALVPGFMSTRLSPSRTLLGCLGVAAVAGGAVQLAFLAGIVVPVVVPLASLAFATVGTLAVAAVLEAFERQRVRDAFARFVPQAVVDVVLDQTAGELRLGGTERECTVLFSDLRGFTSYAETRPPERVIEVLNAYLTEMSDAILDHGGTLVCYMGDGIMAVFGAPLDQPDHRDRALAVAREMLARLDAFNEAMRDEVAGGFRMGIGINTGLVMSGNVGSARRLEFTTIGDTVNTASRIEGMTKGTPYQVFVAESTLTGLRERADDLVYVDEMPVRGRQGGVRLWALAREERSPASDVVALRTARVSHPA